MCACVTANFLHHTIFVWYNNNNNYITYYWSANILTVVKGVPLIKNVTLWVCQTSTKGVPLIHDYRLVWPIPQIDHKRANKRGCMLVAPLPYNTQSSVNTFYSGTIIMV